MERSVKISEPLAQAIDEVVEEAKDELGAPLYRSRAQFVDQACREHLKKVQRRQSN